MLEINIIAQKLFKTRLEEITQDFIEKLLAENLNEFSLFADFITTEKNYSKYLASICPGIVYARYLDDVINELLIQTVSIIESDGWIADNIKKLGEIDEEDEYTEEGEILISLSTAKVPEVENEFFKIFY